MVLAKTTARRDEKHLTFRIWYALYYRFNSTWNYNAFLNKSSSKQFAIAKCVFIRLANPLQILDVLYINTYITQKCDTAQVIWAKILHQRPWWLSEHAWSPLMVNVSCPAWCTVYFQYCQTCNIRHTKSQHLNASHLVLWLSLPNPLKPGVKWRMKM